MTYEQLQELITPIYVLLSCLLIAIAIMTLIKIFEYVDKNKERQDKQTIKDLEERLKTKTEMERLRYEHEQMLKRLEKDENK